MEEFNGNQGQVREKNVYFLQLNTPRIILITSVILGIITATFLLGMNFTKESPKNGMDLAKSEVLFNNSSEAIKVGDLPDDSLSVKEPKSGMEVSDPKNTLTPDKLDKEIQPILDENKEALTDNQGVEKSKPVIKEKAPKKREVVKKEKKSPVKAASAPVKKKREEYAKPKGPYYAVQIASYDSSTKARRELNRLKSMSFKGFIDKKRVEGKNFYRVRIGPIKNRRAALNTLREVQGINRYGDSYLVRE